MCRLLGWATRVPTTLLDLVGEEDLRTFTELSAEHCDGWGVARATGTGVKVHKRADTARHSRAFARWARGYSTDLGLAHLRRATMGLGVGIENTHPFTDGSVAFAHNGSVLAPASLDPLAAPEVTRLRRGTTDSERYFLALLTRMRTGAAPSLALRDTVDEIAGTLPFTSLNCLLLTPDELIAVSRYDPDAPLEDRDPEYYRLRYRVTGDAVVVSSSGWGRGWQELANGDLLVVRRVTLETTVLSGERQPAAR
ncbi:MAG TPA: class II glutamine amidotransferase [Mycobacteriales bacterium]|nr:class II glutamine amidotransferase [Mycobacteriales bacterium]